MPDWDAARYLRFAAERTRPAVDLAARVPLEEVGTAVDLGCGPGNSTEVMADRWPGARITGVDHSEAMLAEARKAHPGWRWERGDIGRWTADPPVDLVFSSASLHWVPDHGALFPRLLDQVGPGGVLAAQMPRNFGAPSHRLMREAGAPWGHRLPAEPAWAGDPAFYYDLLAPRCAAVDLWETEYQHVLEGAEGVLAWVRGTGLRPFLDALDPGDRPAFEARYLDLLREAYAPRADGRVLLPFRRIFLVARR